MLKGILFRIFRMFFAQLTWKDESSPEDYFICHVATLGNYYITIVNDKDEPNWRIYFELCSETEFLNMEQWRIDDGSIDVNDLDKAKRVAQETLENYIFNQYFNVP